MTNWAEKKWLKKGAECRGISVVVDVVTAQSHNRKWGNPTEKEPRKEEARRKAKGERDEIKMENAYILGLIWLDWNDW